MRSIVVLALLLALGCGGRHLTPAALDTSNEPCRHCRMIVSDARLAAQIVAPGEEALFFDDIGCLRNYLQSTRPAADAVAFVADHRTSDWMRAVDAVYTRSRTLSTPMGSGLLAHRDAVSRAADPAAQGGEPLTWKTAFEGVRVPAGGAR
jgi:copper chaperone NosL